MRPPFGRVTLAVAHWAIRKRQRLTLWDLMPADFRPGVSVNRVSRTLLRGVRRGSIVCLHDNDRSLAVTPRALEFSIPRLLDDGWEFALPPVAAATRQSGAAATSEIGQQ